MLRRIGLLAILLLLCGCDTGISTPSGSVLPSIFSAPTVKPVGPDIEQIQIVSVGFGVHDLIVYPVVIVHNRSYAHSAIGVQAIFRPKASGQATSTLKSELVDIPPNATANIAADCTDGCNGTTSVAVKISVASWGGSAVAPVITVSAIKTDCGGCGSATSSGYGTVQGRVSGALIPSHAQVLVYAACHLASGALVGAGTTVVIWGANGSSQTVTVNTIDRVRPAGCTLSALLNDS